MATELEEVVQQLSTEGMTQSQIRLDLLQRGYLEDEVNRVMGAKPELRSAADKRNNRILTWKETLDRVGYGFSSPQIVNILFWLSGASYFLVGIAQGLKTVVSLLLSGFVQEYGMHHTVKKERIALAAVVFAFSFFLMAFALLAESPLFFAIGLVAGAIGVVAHGDLYERLADSVLAHERRSVFLRKAAQLGIVITAVSLIGSALLIDAFQGEIFRITVFGTSFFFRAYGFLFSFMITAAMFIVGSQILLKLPDAREKREYPLGRFIVEHLRAHLVQQRAFLKNRYVVLLLLATVVAGFLQTLGAAYYGIAFYHEFKNAIYGPFVNVALLTLFALLVSFTGPFFTRTVERSTGLAPHLVFGTLLTAILPFVLVYNPRYFAVMAALGCAVIGAAIVGVAQGRIALRIMDEQTRKAYFTTQALMVVIPYIVLFPVGAWVAQVYGLTTLFLIIGFGLAAVVAPLYFILVAMTSEMRL